MKPFSRAEGWRCLLGMESDEGIKAGRYISHYSGLCNSRAKRPSNGLQMINWGNAIDSPEKDGYSIIGLHISPLHCRAAGVAVLRYP